MAVVTEEVDEGDKEREEKGENEERETYTKENSGDTKHRGVTSRQAIKKDNRLPPIPSVPCPSPATAIVSDNGRE